MSKIEAEFKKYLNSLVISRKIRSQNLRLFLNYLSYLKLSGIVHPGKAKTVNFHRIDEFKKLIGRKIVKEDEYNQFITYLTAFIDKFNTNHTNITDSKSLKQYQELLDAYLHYLEKKNFSPATVKNYKSDLQQFLKYAGNKLTDLNISKDIIDGFINYQQELDSRKSTLRRKLSSINSFRNWLLKKSPIKKLTHRADEIKPKVDAHDTLIESSGQSYSNNQNPPAVRFPQSISWFFTLALTSLLSLSIGIGIYQQFFLQPLTSLALPGPTTKPSRIINFQGRLTDNSGNPIVEKTQTRFRIWNQIAGGNTLYDSGYCQVSPDQNGIFYTLIGSTCGIEISSSVFSENISAYLGVSAGSDAEMEPRQQIASVGYALNSETLQGLSPLSPASGNSIPFIDRDGQLLISASSPVVKSDSGLFTLEGTNLLLSTGIGSNGSISLKPDQNGTVNLDFSGFIPASSSAFLNIKAPNLISGSLISAIGSSLTAGYRLLELSSGNPLQVKFSVDAQGNTNISGDLKVSDVFEASSSAVLINSPLTVTNLISDGGLGIFGSNGNTLPVSFDFTKDTTVEFDFKTGTSKIEIAANIDSNSTKYYRFSWNTDKQMEVAKCINGTCTSLATSTLNWTNDTWHHGYIRFISDSIRFDLDNNSGRVNTNTTSDVPKLSSAYIRFVSGLTAISNLRISPNSKIILTAGDTAVGGKIEAADNIISSGQLKTGSFSSAPSNAGNGSLYFNSSDNKLYYWNGSSWVSVYGSGDLMVSGDVFLNSGVFYPSTNSTHEDQSTYFIVADTAGTGSIMTNAGNFASGGTDFAEVFDSDGDLTVGDLVEIAQGSDLESNLPKVKQSSSYQSQKMIGFVTDRAGFVGGMQTDMDKISVKTIGLVGRVPAKVSSINGPIAVGDPLTSSAIPGRAVKAITAGPVIARSLENFSQGEGTILVFVQYGWFDPGKITEETDSNSLIAQFLAPLIQALSKAKLNIEYLIAGNIEAESLTSPVIIAEEIKAGEIIAEEVTAEIIIAGDVAIAGDSTVSGTLYADRIKSQDLDNLSSTFGKLTDRLSEMEKVPPEATAGAAPVNQFADEFDSILSETEQNTSKLLSLYEKVSAFIASSSAEIAQVSMPSDRLIGINEEIPLSQQALTSLKVTGPVSLADTVVAGQLVVDGNLSLSHSQLASIGDYLYLTSQKAIDLMGGKLIVDNEGNLTVHGQIYAEKGIITPQITAQTDNLSIKLGQNPLSSDSARIGGAGTLTVLGNASISGRLSAAKIELDSSDKDTPDRLSASENFVQNGINAPALFSKGSVGRALIIANYREMIIFNENINENTLVYLTPTSSANGRSLYVSGREICPPTSSDPNSAKCKKYFKVALDQAIAEDLSFNWWLVN